MNYSPIVNKYCEGKLKRTFMSEIEPEINYSYHLALKKLFKL